VSPFLIALKVVRLEEALVWRLVLVCPKVVVVSGVEKEDVMYASIP
jgi:hypothetical protein